MNASDDRLYRAVMVPLTACLFLIQVADGRYGLAALFGLALVLLVGRWPRRVLPKKGQDGENGPRR